MTVVKENSRSGLQAGSYTRLANRSTGSKTAAVPWAPPVDLYDDRRSNSWWIDLGPDDRLLTGPGYERSKRLIDIGLVLLTLPFLAVVILLTALLIKLESPRGPILFTQRRTGRDGRRFDMYKFRTMVPDAEERKRELAHLNQLQWPDFKMDQDPRITQVGHFLRRSSLDELPQLINVLKGDMSLVGPRPTSFHPDTYELWHTERLTVQPGITGLWQIFGRGSMEFDERVRLDIAYIDRRSLWLDFLILVHTVTAVLEQRGAV